MRRYLRNKSVVILAVLAAAIASVAVGAVLPASARPLGTSAPTAGFAQVDPVGGAVTLGGEVWLGSASRVDEKLGMVTGWPNVVSPPPQTDRLIGVGFIPGVPRLGVPALTFTDGPARGRVHLPTTALPAPGARAPPLR